MRNLSLRRVQYRNNYLISYCVYTAHIELKALYSSSQPECLEGARCIFDRCQFLSPCPPICSFLFLDHPPGDILTPDSSLLYLCLEWFNFVRKYNFDILEKNAEDRPDGVPLVTVCNHSSCLDDPCLWGKTYFSLIICLRNVFVRNYWQSLWISGEFPTGEKVFELFPTFQNSIRLFFGNVNILNIRTHV